MIVKNFIGDGLLGENSFVIIDEKTGEKAIVDPSFERGFDFTQFDRMDYILLTHGHFDHVAFVSEIKEKYNSKIVCHECEAEVLEKPECNLSTMFGMNISLKPDIKLKDKEILMLGETKIQAIHTPGHTQGGTCYVVENHIFTGDTVMAGTIGRTDFKGGSYKEIMQSVAKLKKLDGDYTLHCGHGANTSLETEKKYNQYFKM